MGRVFDSFTVEFLRKYYNKRETSMNKITIMGRMGSDIELKQVGEHTLGKFTVATTKKIKGEEKTQWHNVQVWNKTAEIISKYTGKGKRVLVEGEVEYNKYEKDGQTKYFTQINGNNVSIIDFNDSESAPKPRAAVDSSRITATELPF